MTIETAMKILKELHDNSLFSNRTALETIIPELKESEDETIRKEIIEFVDINTLSVDERHDRWIAWLEKQCYTKKDVDDAYLKGISDAKNELEKQGKQDARYRCLEELLAADDIYQMSVNDTMTNEAKEKAAKALSKLCIGKLLGFEKQGEQKTAVTDFNAKDWYVSKVDGKIHDMTYNPADKVEPKFHEGEWVVNNSSGGVYQVTEIRDDEYCLWPLYAEIQGYFRIIDVDTDYHLWIIQDAKDGDVLVDVYGNIGIFQKNDDFDWSSYCSLGSNGGFRCFAIEHELDGSHPATKEQRDTLMKAMADAGYEWLDKDRKLIKIVK